MALFGKGAPPVALLRRAQDRFRSFETALRASSGRAGEETGFPWMTSRMTKVTRKRGEAKVA
jgi:hypothetical protein